MSFSITLGLTTALAASLIGTSGMILDSSGKPDSHISLPTNQGSSAPTKIQRVNGTFKKETLAEILKEIAKSANVEIAINANSPTLQKRVTRIFVNTPILDAIRSAINGTDLEVRTTDDKLVYIIRNKSDLFDTTKRSKSGQERYKVSGRVIDADSKLGIAGVTVSITSTKKTVTTDASGKFSLDGFIPGSYVLSFRLMGYVSVTRNIAIKSESLDSVNILLKQSAASLAEVVTTVSGQQRRIEVPSDIVKIDADQIRERAPVRNLVDMLEAAQVPGVVVARAGGDPGAPSRIRIRGISSISQSNDPVIIMDGVFLDIASGTGPSRLDDIDPATIESIEIVRGPSAATLYGQDAANGVIVITSKKGKVGPTRWNLAYKKDWGQTYGTLPLVYVGMGRSPISTRLAECSVAQVVEYTCQQERVNIFDPNHELLSREGVETNNSYSLQMDGGSANITYAVTISTGKTIGVRRVAEVDKIRFRVLGYGMQSEFNRPSQLTRNNLSTNFTFNPRSNLNVALSLNGTQTFLTDNSFSVSWNHLFPTVLAGGVKTAALIIDTIFQPIYGGASVTALEKPTTTSSRTIASNIQYTPGGGYLLRANFGVEENNSSNSVYGRQSECNIVTNCFDTLGTRSLTTGARTVYTGRMSASKDINIPAISRFLELRGSIGGDWRKTANNSVSINKSAVPVGDRSINQGHLNSSTSIEDRDAIAGWYLNSTIGLFRRIYFDLGVRQDVGSAITSSANTAYPKIGGSWLVSEESFWRENRVVNSLRFRSAIGHAAVQPHISDIDGKFGHNLGFINNRYVNLVDLQNLGNPRLVPERSVEVEFGFDADLLDNKLNLIATYAQKENRNTLVVRSLPPSFGSQSSGVANSIKENIARVRNRNFEFMGTGRIIESNAVLLLVNMGLTLGDNRVMKLGDGVLPFGLGADKVAEGYPLASAWGQKVLGYRDLNGDGLLAVNEVVLSDSSVYLGWSQPRSRASYGISLSLHNRLVFDSRFASQSKYVQIYSPDARYGSEDVNASLAEQANAIIPGLLGRRPVSDVKWNSASVTYHLPTNLLKSFGGRTASVSLQGRDLAIWTNYIGRDPGVNNSIVGENFGDDGRTPPRPRLFVLDFKIGL